MSKEDQEHVLPLRQKDDDKLSDPGLISSVAENLAALGGEPADDELDPDPTPDDEKVNVNVDEDNEKVNVNVDEDDSQADEDEDSDPTPEDGDDPLAGMPSAYMRSAEHFGWDETAVKDMVEKVGIEHVTSMLSDLHGKDNNLTTQFADLGRQAKDSGDPAPDISQANDPADKPASVDVAALRERYGEDDPIVDLVVSQQKNIDQLGQRLDTVNGKLSSTQNTLTRQEFERQEESKRELNSFFTGQELVPYEKFYGKLDEGENTWGSLTTQQRVNRSQVCTLADDIMRGAGMRGVSMPGGEALARAHAVVSEPIAESVTRKKIMGEVEKRHNARVVRPSKSKSTSSVENKSGKPKSRRDLISRTNDRLEKAFN